MEGRLICSSTRDKSRQIADIEPPRMRVAVRDWRRKLREREGSTIIRTSPERVPVSLE
jgi:hypothetical protein